MNRTTARDGLGPVKTLGDCRNCFTEIKPGNSHVSISLGACRIVDSVTGRELGNSRRHEHSLKR